MPSLSLLLSQYGGAAYGAGYGGAAAGGYSAPASSGYSAAPGYGAAAPASYNASAAYAQPAAPAAGYAGYPGYAAPAGTVHLHVCIPQHVFLCLITTVKVFIAQQDREVVLIPRRNFQHVREQYFVM